MKDVLKSIIVEFQQRELPELSQRKMIVDCSLPIIVSLVGARRSGKTFLLYQTMKDLASRGIPRQNMLFLNFEDERLTLQTKDLDLILQAFSELYPDKMLSDCYFFFDEIQNVDGWEKFIRRIFDNISKHIFITGSNAKILSTEIADSLRGRTLTYTVFPLNFLEYLGFMGIAYDLIHPQKRARLIYSAEQFIMYGGFPEVIQFAKDVRMKVLQSYFNTMIYRDIVERYKVNDVQLLKFFIKKLFANISKPLSINRIYNDLRSLGYKVSNNYLYEYEHYACAVFLGVSIPKFDFSEIKQEKSDKKMYAIDTGLLSAVEFILSENRGKLLENTVLLELVKAEYEVFYFKEKYECDFVVRKGKILLPVQVSWQIEDEQTQNREVRGLREVCQKINVQKAQIVTFDQKKTLIDGEIEIQVIPFYEWVMDLVKESII
jgi:predicted AAA+ superfamily ATPase